MSILFKNTIHTKVSLLLVCFLTLFSCNSGNDLNLQEEEGIVYLLISKDQFTQDTDEEGSINSDSEYYDDRVNSLAVFIFDAHDSESKAVATLFDDNILETIEHLNYTLKLKEGDFDFYFIANLSKKSIEHLVSKTDVESFMSERRQLPEYLVSGANKLKGFPMARVYKNQSVRAGGTVYNPIPFRPNGKDKISLIRAVAKIEVELKGDVSQFEMLKLRNGQKEYSLTSNSSLPLKESLSYHEFKRVSENSLLFRLYLPELLLKNRDSKVWSWQSKDDQEYINYITIQLRDNRYKIPLVANGELAPQGKYLDFALGKLKELTPDYSIERNQYYKLDVKLPEIGLPEEELTIQAKVMPWIWHNVENHDNDGKEITEFPTLDVTDFAWFVNNNTLQIHHGTSTPPIHFWLKSPAGAEWKATLSNGLQFAFAPNQDGVVTDSGTATEIEDEGKREIRIQAVAPLKDLSVKNITEVYFTVNGKEVPLRVKLGNRTLTFYGKGNRLQVEQLS